MNDYKIKKLWGISTFVILLVTCIGCNHKSNIITPKNNSTDEQSMEPTVTESILATPTVITEATEIAEVLETEKPNIIVEDYSELFADRNGCAVIYDTDKDEYLVYNEVMINTEVSPYSTFKIVATLMGLKNHILEDETTTMNYNETQYSIEAWNHDLTLYEAFQASCVWYFRQVIDGIGDQEVQKELMELNYGNQDISEWNGTESDSPAELKGFWLGSSLKISPMEQVQLLNKIFQGQSQYTTEQIELLKDIMLTDESNGYQILGKTGTGPNEGWYVGIADKEDHEYYFAVYLNGAQGKQSVSGAVARKILTNIFCEK